MKAHIPSHVTEVVNLILLCTKLWVGEVIDFGDPR